MPNESAEPIEARLRRWSADGAIDFKRTFGFAPTRWLQLVDEHGPLGACKEVLKPHPEQWWVGVLTPLWEKRRLQWSAEALALTAEFSHIFTDEERAIAKERLAKFGYEPPA